MPTDTTASSGGKGSRGLQEERVERDAWAGILSALTRLKEAQARDLAQLGQDAVNEGNSSAMQEG